MTPGGKPGEQAIHQHLGATRGRVGEIPPAHSDNSHTGRELRTNPVTLDRTDSQPSAGTLVANPVRSA